MDMTVNTSCRICRSQHLKKALDFGDQPLANSFLHQEDIGKDESRYPLEAYVCERCNLTQLIHVVSKELLFRDYLYLSSEMPALSEHFREYADDIMSRYLRDRTDLVAEIGSNDGILLQYFKEKGYRVCGVDPARNIVPLAEARGVPTVADFFSERVARKVRAERGEARVIIGNNVVAHIDDYFDLCRAVRALLSPDGVFVFEAPYLADMFESLRFDTVYHEHLNYLSVRPLQALFEQFDMEIFRVEVVPAQGQSIRVFVGRRGFYSIEPSVAECADRELTLGLNKVSAYETLAARIVEAREKVRSVLFAWQREGKKLAAYGAPAKGNTVLNYYDIGTDLLAFAIDDLSTKQGCLTPGKHLPVVSRIEAERHAPDAYLLLAWNYLPVILEKERAFLERGGKFLLPTGEVIVAPESAPRSSVRLSERRAILVAGGAGFIGSNFVRHLYKSYPSCRIVNLDILSYCGNRANLADIEETEARLPEGGRRYAFVHGDICNGELLGRALKEYGVEAVVNFAAESHVDRSLCSSYDFIRTNVLGVHTLLEACRGAGVSRYLQISTDEVYGDIAEGFADESAPLRPSNPYAASKAGADALVLSFVRSHHLPALIIRGSNNFGPYQYPEKLLPLAISNFMEGRLVPMHGSGDHVRSWLYVEDFCRAIDAVLRGGEIGEIYNASGSPRTNREMLAGIHRLLGIAAPFEQMLSPVHDRPGADLRYAPASDKLRRKFGWAPASALDEDLARTVAWYKANESWWRPLKSQPVFLEHYKRQQKADYY